MTDPLVIPIEITNSVQAVPVGTAIVVEGVEIPPLLPGARWLDELLDVTGASLGTTGQVLARSSDGQWRPATVGGGGGLASYSVQQATPAASWVIAHPLGRTPQVTVIDPDGNRVWPDVTYSAPNVVTITHAEPLAGTAILT